MLSERKRGECAARRNSVSGPAVCKGLGTLQPAAAAVIWQPGASDSMRGSRQMRDSDKHPSASLAEFPS